MSHIWNCHILSAETNIYLQYTPMPTMLLFKYKTFILLKGCYGKLDRFLIQVQISWDKGALWIFLIVVHHRGRWTEARVAEHGGPATVKSVPAADFKGATDYKVLEQVSLLDVLLEPVQGDVRHVWTDLLHVGDVAQTHQVSLALSWFTLK